MELFKHAIHDLPGTPLAERMRPQRPEGVLGQAQAERLLKRVRLTKQIPSLILWGPPGTGKTSFAQALVRELDAQSISVNAIEIGAKALRELGQAARDQRLQFQRQTVLFIDEIHRLNKSQQDVLLPFVERGEFVLIGATTENPAYGLNRALMSRCQLVLFERLPTDTLLQLLTQSFAVFHRSLSETLSSEAISALLEYADGDARKLLSAVESVLSSLDDANLERALTPLDLQKYLGARSLGYDRTGDQHYDVISAFIKSIRGSDADAGLYYLARMLKAGEDPVFIARRLVVLASEDVGNADPRALSVAVAGAQAVELIGLPEAAINLAQVVTYLACAPKSNRSYVGLRQAQEFVETTGTQPIPLHLRSSQTELMKSVGYGKGYKYPHDHVKHYVEQNYFPETIKEKPQFYEPSERGFEKQIREYLKWLKE